VACARRHHGEPYVQRCENAVRAPVAAQSDVRSML
jgi:hypothetical protein